RYLPAGPYQPFALLPERVVADPVERPGRPHPGRRDRPGVVRGQVQHDGAALPDHASLAVYQTVLAFGPRALQVLEQRRDRQADPPDRMPAAPGVPPGVDVNGSHASSAPIVRADTGIPRSQPSLTRPCSYRARQRPVSAWICADRRSRRSRVSASASDSCPTPPTSGATSRWVSPVLHTSRPAPVQLTWPASSSASVVSPVRRPASASASVTYQAHSSAAVGSAA